MLRKEEVYICDCHIHMQSNDLLYPSDHGSGVNDHERDEKYKVRTKCEESAKTLRGHAWEEGLPFSESMQKERKSCAGARAK